MLLVEGANASVLYEYTRPECSESARRNTNLFRTVVRDKQDIVPYAQHLSRQTDSGYLVRSKSELVIANMLHSMGMPAQYERPLEGSTDHQMLRPHFAFAEAAGEPFTVGGIPPSL